jgi:PAS domain S-box-containing protein
VCDKRTALCPLQYHRHLVVVRFLPSRRIRLGTIFALLVLITTVPLVLFAARLIFTSWQQQQAMVDRQNVERARAIGFAIDQEVQTTIAALKVLASLEPIDRGNLEDFHALASSILPFHNGWQSVRLVSGTAEVLVDTSSPFGQTAILLSDDWVRAVIETRRPAVSALKKDPATGQFVIAVGVPVIQDDTVKFVVGARIRASLFSDVIRRQKMPPDGVVSLLDANRITMARSRNEERYVGQPPSPDFAEQSLRIQEGYWRTRLLEGEPAYGALTRSQLSGWTLGLAIPTRTVDGPILSSLRALIAVGIGILFGGFLLALLISHRLVAAQVAAVGAARSLARGDPLSLPPSPIVEINDLSDGLEEAASILAQRLRERERAEVGLSEVAEHLERALAGEQAARAAGERNEARLTVTLTSIGDAVIATDAEGLVTVLNPVAQALTGWSESDALGQPIDSLFRTIDERTRKPLAGIWDRVLRANGTVTLSGHAVLLSRDGREIPVSDTAAPMRTADGALVGMVVVFRDVTVEREAERHRAALLEGEQNARYAAEALNRAKDEFVATVSHELRTPLNAIFGWVAMLKTGTLDEARQARALEVIERNTQAQTQLVEDLLDMARAIRGTVHLELQQVDVAGVLEAAVDSVKPAADRRGVSMTVTCAPALALVSGDPSRLQQVIWNLLANAIKFSEPGGEVHVRLTNESDYAVLRIRDTGGGIDPEFLPHVFDRFRQERSDVTREHAGLGIGLSLVRHLAELHGGTVTAESQGKNQGSTFTVRLPLLAERQGRPGPLTTVTPVLLEPTSPAGARTDALMGLELLVVDDDEDARDLIASALQQAGGCVRSAPSVGEALVLIESRLPDIVITDIAMPHATGFDLVRQVRADPRSAATPVIALTAYSRAEDRAQALSLGFNAHIGKPFSPSALVSLVASLVRR